MISLPSDTKVLLQRIGFDGSLILHSLEEEQVASSAAFVRERMNT